MVIIFFSFFILFYVACAFFMFIKVLTYARALLTMLNLTLCTIALHYKSCAISLYVINEQSNYSDVSVVADRAEVKFTGQVDTDHRHLEYTDRDNQTPEINPYVCMLGKLQKKFVLWSGLVCNKIK